MLAVFSFDDVMRLVVAGGCCGIPALLAIVVLVGGRKGQKRLLSAVAKVTEAERAEVLRLVKEAAPLDPTVFNIIPTGESTRDDKTLIRLPTTIPNYPWAGRCLTVERGPELDLVWTFVESDSDGVAIKGRLYGLEGVPRRLTSKGKERNVFLSSELLKYSPDLKELLARLYPYSPERMLDELLPKQIASEGQIGGHPTWQQDPDLPKCKICGKNMVLIMELYDSAIEQKGNWLFYFFGCRTHPDSTATRDQGG